MSWNRAKFAPVVLVIFGVALIATSQLFGLPGVGAQTGATYHVDCANGNDNHNGTSPANAWKTLTPVKKANLSSGDSLLFKRDCTWQGPFQAKWTGSAGAPIRIGAYGNGALPKFARGSSTNVLITGAYQIIEDVQTQNVLADYARIEPDGQPFDWKIGFNFQGGAHHNTIQRVRTAGHAIGVNFSDNTHHNRVLDSFIGNNFGIWSNTTAATGVLLHGDANEIAYNRFENNVALKRPAKSISLEVYNNTRGNIHHNVSYDRVFAEMGSGNITSADNVFAYNSQWSNYQPEGNAKGAEFVITRGAGCPFGPVRNTMLYNNTVYLTGKNSQGVVAGCTKGGNVLTMKNNIIVTREKGYYVGGGGAVESNNVFWPVGGLPAPNNFLQGQAPHATSQVAEPQFVDAGGRDLRLKASSPAVDAGSFATVNAGYTTDLYGTSVPQGPAPDAGVHEREGGGGSGEDIIVEPEIPSSVSLPGRFEAENYRQGGEGVGYHDTTPENLGGAYRNDGVDIQPTLDTGGFNVGWPAVDEWLAYNAEVQASGKYVFTFRVASMYSNQSFHVQLDGVNVTGSVSVPNTGEWQVWTDVSSQPVDIAAGSYTLKIVAESSGYNINHVDVTETEQEIVTAISPTALPGRIEAENYREGGPGAGYDDTTPENLGGAYRNDGVDIQPTTDTGGGYNVGWPDGGEWLAYDVTVATAGNYSFTVRVASLYDGRSFHLELDDVNVTGSIAVPNTNGWQNWTDVTSEPVNIPPGNHTLKLVAETDGYNVNYIDVTEAVQATSSQAAAAATVSDDASNETVDAPAASFIVACDELTCSFDSSASSGAIETHSWDFGDGSSESGATVSHPYSEGTYTATLTVTDGTGQSSTFSQEIVVATSAESPSTASFVHSCDALTRACEFDASQSEGDISGYEWDFGDGSPVTAGAMVSHAYAAGGSYTVTLTIANGSGTDTNSQTVELPFTMHVADLDGSGIVDRRGWTAEVAVTVHDEDNKPVADVTVVGAWSNSGSTEFSCTTDASGRCTIDNGDGVGAQHASVVFTITDLNHAAYVYDETANHVPEQDNADDDESDGTSIIVSQAQ